MLASGSVPSTEFGNCYTVPAGPANTPPDAVPQEVSTPQNESLQIDLQGTDLDDDDLSFSIDSEPSSGTVEFGEIGTDCTSENSCTVPVFYTPSPGFTGTATFPFSVNDGVDSSSPATVTINVGEANAPPVAVDTSAVAQENDSVVVQLEGSDADGDALTFDVQPASAQGGSVGAVSDTRVR